MVILAVDLVFYGSCFSLFVRRRKKIHCFCVSAVSNNEREMFSESLSLYGSSYATSSSQDHFAEDASLAQILFGQRRFGRQIPISFLCRTKQVRRNSLLANTTLRSTVENRSKLLQIVFVSCRNGQRLRSVMTCARERNCWVMIVTLLKIRYDQDSLLRPELIRSKYFQ